MPMAEDRIGNYRVIRQLGEGGMGVVYEAVREDIGVRAAIKVLRLEFARHPEIAARFFQEARAANLIQHPGIVRIFDYGQLPSGSAYLAMEYLDGESLRARLLTEERLSEAVTLRIGRQIASALATAHASQVVHRDLKPENVMMVPDVEAPSGERAKIVDFGIAKLQSGAGMLQTRANMLMGTPVYMSPEQCRGARNIDEKVDVYALGVMLYEMLAGRPPFLANAPGEYIAMHMYQEPPSLRQVIPDVDRSLEQLIATMMSKEATARPSMLEAAQVLKDLGNLTSDVVSVRALQDGSTVASRISASLRPPVLPETLPLPSTALASPLVEVAGQAGYAMPASNRAQTSGAKVMSGPMPQVVSPPPAPNQDPTLKTGAEAQNDALKTVARSAEGLDPPTEVNSADSEATRLMTSDRPEWKALQGGKPTVLAVPQNTEALPLGPQDPTLQRKEQRASLSPVQQRIQQIKASRQLQLGIAIAGFVLLLILALVLRSCGGKPDGVGSADEAGTHAK
jgi:serine/threonine protein kinase